MKFKVSNFVALALSSVLTLGVADAEETIKIVSSLPRTGSANAQTNSITNGVRLAIEEVGGRVGGFKIEFLDWDDASPERGAWDPALEAANADKAIADPDVMAYIGPYNSGAAKISMPKLNRAGLLQVNGFATAPGLTKPGMGEPNEPMVYRPSGRTTFFRVIPADDIQGAVAAEWAKEMGVQKVFVLDDREVYGKGVSKVFRQAAAKLGIELVGYEGIDPKASNYKSLVTKIKQKAPDLVYFGGTTQSNAGQLAKDLRAGGSTLKLMVPDGCFERAFIEAAGKENLEGLTYITFGGVPPEKLVGQGQVFVEKYQQKFGGKPEAYAVYGYEAAKVVLRTIEVAGKKDRQALLDAAAKIQDFDGALGKWSVDANGDTTLRTMSGNTVKDGDFSFVKLLGSQ